MKVALTVNDFLRRAEEVYPHRLAVVDEPDQPAESWGSYTYAEMAAKARAIAAHLDALGIAHTYIEPPNVSHSPTGIINALGADFWAFHREALIEADRLLGDGFE